MKTNGTPLQERPAVPQPRFGVDTVIYGEDTEPFNNQVNLPIRPFRVIMVDAVLGDCKNLDISDGRKDLA